MMRIQWMSRILLVGLAPALTVPAGGQQAHPLKQGLFEKAFGEAARLDPAMVEKVKGGGPEDRYYVDRDDDGKPEEVWFVDHSLVHPEIYRPVLVRAIDEDGDLTEGGWADSDSDLYVADWNADGGVDGVVDYVDLDGDQDVDQMRIFFFQPHHPEFGGPVLRFRLVTDEGDDNLLAHTSGYVYNQAECQYRYHFGGNETFSNFVLPINGEEWIPFFETPFGFYDRDGDGASEEVIRIHSSEAAVESLRWSFDADNDNGPENPRDYDFSINAWAPGSRVTPEGDGKNRSTLRYVGSIAETLVNRGIPTGPFLRFGALGEFVREAEWHALMLAWDEIDHNVDKDFVTDVEIHRGVLGEPERPDVSAERGNPGERWEGVIASGNEWFRQIGGPDSGGLNVRFEVAGTPAGKAELYFHPTDRRLHLRGAERAWMDVDWDLDGKKDAGYSMTDGDGDGWIDTWSFDADGDGAADDEWRAAEGAAPVAVGITFAEINGLVGPAVGKTAREVYVLNEYLRRGAEKAGGRGAAGGKKIDYDYDYDARLTTHEGDKGNDESLLRRKLAASEETARFYLEVERDMLIAGLKGSYRNAEFWERFDAARAAGDALAMATAAGEAFGVGGPEESYEAWRERLRGERVRRVAGWEAREAQGNIGWETDGPTAWRFYNGMFDFFGKQEELGRLLIFELAELRNYHHEQPWGIDALLVGDTAGAGGVTLYVNGEGYPVRNAPGGPGAIEFKQRFAAQEDERIVVEIVAGPVGPAEAPYTVRMRCESVAGRETMAVEVTVSGGRDGEALELGVGLTRLAQEQVVFDPEAGALGVWGRQSTEIGTIGMGVVFAPERLARVAELPGEHQAVLEIGRGEPVRYGLRAEWLKGRRFDCCPSAQDWLTELRRGRLAVRE